MTRLWSREVEPHRELAVHDDPQRGEDIRALQVAARKRLDARGISRPIAVDGVFGPRTKDALDSAAWWLGALEGTVKAETLSLGAQGMIRYPGRRNPKQLARAVDRMDELRWDRDHASKAGGVSALGLSVSDAIVARGLAISAFNLLYHHAPAVHYTQGARRWDGINRNLKAFQGQYPNYADCSAAFTWAWWNGLAHIGVGDILNGLDFSAGYTGTLLLHGTPVETPVRGCAVIYGTRWPGEHVAMYDDNGRVYSHGSEAGPFYLDMHYRTDILSIRQYV